MEKVTVVDINGTPHRIDKGTQPDFPVLARWSGNRYLVLASNDGDLYDPVGKDKNLQKRDRKRGGLLWRLKTCSKECYDQYTTFLRSGNRTPYILAQRRFRNDVR